MKEKKRDSREHDSRTRLAETCGARDESPTPNLGRVKQGKQSEQMSLKPTVGGRMASRRRERVRTCFAQVVGKAGTDPPERRDRRRTEADDAE